MYKIISLDWFTYYASKLGCQYYTNVYPPPLNKILGIKGMTFHKWTPELFCMLSAIKHMESLEA